MMKFLLPGLAATLLLASCETKCSETKDQLGEAGQDTAVMARDGQHASQAAGDATASAANTWDMTKAKLADMKFKEVATPGVTVRCDST